MADLYDILNPKKKEDEGSDLYDQLASAGDDTGGGDLYDTLASAGSGDSQTVQERNLAALTPEQIAEQNKRFSFTPRTQLEADIAQMDSAGLETPWVDPIDAVSAPVGFATAGGKGLASFGRALMGSLATEVPVGVAVEQIDRVAGGEEMHPAARMPLNLVTALVSGAGSDALLKGFGKTAKAVSPVSFSTNARQDFIGQEGRKLVGISDDASSPHLSADEPAPLSLEDFARGASPRNPKVEELPPATILKHADEDVPATIRPDATPEGRMKGDDIIAPQKADDYDPYAGLRFDEEGSVRMDAAHPNTKEAAGIDAAAIAANNDRAYNATKKGKQVYVNDNHLDHPWIREGGFTNKEVQKALQNFSEGKRLGPVQQRIVNAWTEHTERQLNQPGMSAAAGGDVKLHSNPVKEMYRGLTKLWTDNIGTPAWDALALNELQGWVTKIPGVKAGHDAIRNSSLGKGLQRMVKYGWRDDLSQAGNFNHMVDQMRINESLGFDYAIDLGQRLQRYGEADQLKIGDFLRGDYKGALPEHLVKDATEARAALVNLGHKAVQEGLLDEEVFFKNLGRYMPRLYSKFEYQGKLAQFGLKKPTRMDLSRFESRKDIPKEIREAMGEILTPGYPVAKGVAQLTSDIEKAKFFRGIAENQNWATKIPEPKVSKTGTLFYEAAKKDFEKATAAAKAKGWEQLPKSKKLGELSEAWVHPEIAREVNQVQKLADPDFKHLKKAWSSFLSSWKIGKVIVSPKTHMRNIMSNSFLAHLGGMPIVKQPLYLAKAAKDMHEGGKYWQIAKQNGLASATWSKNELKNLYDNINLRGDAEAGSVIDALGIIGSAYKAGRTGVQKMADIYDGAEQWYKIAKLIHNMESKGMGAAEAAADAEKWLFNYGKLTPFQQAYRNSPLGAPFATFGFKALPRVLESTMKYPWRIAAPVLSFELAKELVARGTDEHLPDSVNEHLPDRVRYGFDEQPEVTDAKESLREDWMQGRSITDNFMRVPFTDEYGREYWLNLTYILPWGDIGESGNFMGIPGSLMPMSMPGVNDLVKQRDNFNPFFESQIAPDKELAGRTPLDQFATEAKLRGTDLFNSLAPTPVVDAIKQYQAFQGQPDYRGRFRPSWAVAADAFLGLKMYPVDYADRVIRIISEVSPSDGEYGRYMKGQIKRLTIQRNALMQRGKDITAIDAQIKEKIEQLGNLGGEVAEKGKLFQTIKQGQPYSRTRQQEDLLSQGGM